MAAIKPYLNKWNLTATEKIAETKSSFVYKVNQENQPAILKLLTEVGRASEAAGAAVLECYQAEGAVRLLGYDEGAQLLEYLDGQTLKSLVREGRDADAAHVICDVLDRLHSYDGARPMGVPDVRERFQALFRRADKEADQSVYVRGARVARSLLSSQRRSTLLHGDIHHTNILEGRSRGWNAIDPQGVWGERSYDVANVFFNPDDDPVLVETPARIRALAEIFSRRLNVEVRRVLEFAFAYGALSSAWQLDEGGSPQRRLRITALIETVLTEG